MNYRDLSLIDIGDKKLIFATDSSGAIGMKENDQVRIDNYRLGRFLAQVPFMEIMATGAEPFYVFLPIANEMEPTAAGIIEGVKSIMKDAGMDLGSINGSTEENMATSQTGAAITIMAVVDGNFKLPKAKRGQGVFSIGLPKVGQEVLNDRGEIMTLYHLKELRKMDFVGDILPVGSKGIYYEAGEMARSNSLELELIFKEDLIYKSAGPATVALCSAPEDKFEELKKLALPVNLIARLV